MNYSIKKSENKFEWIINNSIHVALCGHELGTFSYFMENTNVQHLEQYNKDQKDLIFELLLRGFIPQATLFGSKITSTTNQPFFVVNDSIQWFTFYGIKDLGVDANKNHVYDKLSIAVNFDAKKNLFTVYQHGGNKIEYPDDFKRIGVFDNVSTLFKLTEDYLPIVRKVHRADSKTFNTSEAFYDEIDWSKLYFCCDVPELYSQHFKDTCGISEPWKEIIKTVQSAYKYPIKEKNIQEEYILIHADDDGLDSYKQVKQFVINIENDVIIFISRHISRVVFSKENQRKRDYIHIEIHHPTLSEEGQSSRSYLLNSIDIERKHIKDVDTKTYNPWFNENDLTKEEIIRDILPCMGIEVIKK